MLKLQYVRQGGEEEKDKAQRIVAIKYLLDYSWHIL